MIWPFKHNKFAQAQGFKNVQVWGNLLLAAAFLGAFGSICFYQMTGAKLHFFHESAFPLLYANTNLDTFMPFSSRFSGREISPLSWPLVGSVVLLFLPISLTAHTITCLLFSLFVALTVTWFCRTAKFTLSATLLILTLFFISYTKLPSYYLWTDQVWVWPMNSYGLYDMFSLISAIAVIRLIQKYSIDSKTVLSVRDLRVNTGVALSIIWFFTTGLNSTRGFVTISGPVLFAYFFDQALMWRGTLKPHVTIATKYIALCGIMTLLAVAITLHFTNGVPQYYQEPHKYFTIASADELSSRFFSFPASILQLFDAIPEPNQPIFSLYGIIKITVSIFALFLLGIPFFRLSLNNGESRQIERLLIFKYIYTLILLLVTTLYGTSHGNPRYYLPLVYSALFVFTFVINDWTRQKEYGKLFMICALILPSYVHSINILTAYGFHDYKQEKFYRFAQFLKSHDLTYGYGGPYESNILTLWQRSRSAVKLGLVDIQPLQGHRHADKKLFDPAFYSGSTFMAVRNDERATSLKIQALAKEKSIGTLTFEDFTIDIYPYNIAVNLDKPYDQETCLKVPDTKYLETSVSTVIAGEGFEISCSGWGNVISKHETYARNVIDNATAYLAGDKFKRSLQIDGLAWFPNMISGNKRPSLLIYANGEKLGYMEFSGSERIETRTFDLPEPIAASAVINVEVHPSNIDKASDKDTHQGIGLKSIKLVQAK